MLTTTIEPFEHQIVCAEHAISMPHSLNLSEVGTGKTLPAIMAAEHRIDSNQVKRVLIVCPLSVVSNWQFEIKRATGKDTTALIGPRKKRLDALKGIATTPTIEKGGAPMPIPHICSYYIINIEGVRLFLRELIDCNFDMVIIDEIHRLKTSLSKQSKACYELGDRAKYRIGLTGTPLLNSAMDIFGIYRFIDPNIFGWSFWAFRGKYFYDANNGKKWCDWPAWTIRPASKIKISEEMYSVAIRYLKQDCLDLPDLLFEKRMITMLPDQAKNYAGMARDLITYVKDRTVVAQIILTKIMKLAQIASGWAKDDQGQTIDVMPLMNNPKIRALKEIIEEIGPEQRLVVWCHFRHDIELVAAALDTDLIIHGGIPATDRTKYINFFKATPGEVLVAQPGAGGEGINLAEAKYAVYFSRGYSLKDREQSVGRTHRHGSEHHDKVTVIDIVADKTIDVGILDALQKKEDLAKTIVDRLRGAGGIQC